MAKPKLDENFVAEQVAQIIEKLGVSATVEVSREDDEPDPKTLEESRGPAFFVDISSEDSSLLIGKYGANLESLQFVLAVRLKTLTGEENFELIVDVDGWRQQREEKLKDMALSIADKVTETKTAEPIYNLKAYERKIIHSVLTDHPSVTTISEGEGLDRHLIVKSR